MPLLGAIAGVPLLGIGGGVGVHWRIGAIAGDRGGWAYKLADWMW